MGLGLVIAGAPATIVFIGALVMRMRARRGHVDIRTAGREAVATDARLAAGAAVREAEEIVSAAYRANR